LLEDDAARLVVHCKGTILVIAMGQGMKTLFERIYARDDWFVESGGTNNIPHTSFAEPEVP
jgi:hypothetical protein